MFGKSKQTTDLTTPDAVAKSQKVYDRMTSGKTKDVTAELDAVHGAKSKRR